MTQFSGKFKYFLDNKEITDINDLKTFNNLSYTTKIDGLNVYFSTVSAPKCKVNIDSSKAPFFLDEIIFVDDVKGEVKIANPHWSRQKNNQQETEKTVHSNIFNNEQYCPRKERVKDVEKKYGESSFENFTNRYVTAEDVERGYFNFTNFDKFFEEQKKENPYKAMQEIVDKNKKSVLDDLKGAGIKETEGKKEYSEINLEVLDLMADRFSANKHKYPKNNMKKFVDIKNLEWALFRHCKKMIQPIDNDPETYKEHLAAILCNCSMILDQLNLQDKK